MVTTLAGSGNAGSTNGSGIAASFDKPAGIAVDALGVVYVADQNNNKIRKITPGGVVTDFAGNGFASSTYGVGLSSSFNSPFGVALDALGNLYVSDAGGNKIRKITSVGVVTTLAGSGIAGNDDGIGTSASFSFPSGIALDALGNVYVADAYNNKIRKVTSSGMVSTFAGSGAPSGSDYIGILASFNNPAGVTIDAFGNVYVADLLNNKIRKITSAGVVTTLAGSSNAGGSDGSGSGASFNSPVGITIDASGNVYITDALNNRIRKISTF